MTTCIECSASQPRAALSRRATTLTAAITAITFAASGAAPTTLYHHYQEAFGLTPFVLTIIFGAYVLSLLGALLTIGSLSDYIGRRPAVLAALALNVVSMIMFIVADSAAALIAARAVQGFATGLATATLGAAIMDNDKSRGPILNSITAFIGLTAGSLGGGVLVTYGPDPQQLVYAVLLVLSAAEALLLWFMPETVTPKAGVLASLQPHVSIPARAQRALMQVTPVTIASWALGGFYFSLMPSLIRVATGVTAPVVGGLVVSALTFSGAMAVLALRNTSARSILSGGIPALVAGVAITLLGVKTQHVSLMLAGTIVAGLGFGAAFSGSMRTVMPHAEAHERAGLLSAFYVEGYLSFSLPAILTGLIAPISGLPLAAEVYGGVVIVLAIVSLLAMLRSGQQTTVG
ncbi:MFS transporter [Rhodoplanes sp. Z2-YC6860]|uniref:MFS transporter n=1 Tax=Rhodoplanes sp. Z2-YC6860 TaxID=674703 RepID=UPI00078EC313|nr:MFS transporter [Rhodoplanes sp. Z2-YC6860]AMN38553.1 Major Facilitator Superfamily transporter [Rhodoplanes sp. Z2-YC6860]